MLVLIAIIVGVVAMVSVFVIYQPPVVTHVVTVTTSESNISVSVVDDLTVTGELDMTSKSQPLLPPRVTTSEMNAMTTSQGALVYNTEENNVYIFDGTTWGIVGSPSSVFDPVMVYATRTAGNYNADTTIVFNNQLLDNNNAYDNTTGIFTVPVGKGAPTRFLHATSLVLKLNVSLYTFPKTIPQYWLQATPTAVLSTITTILVYNG